MEQKDYKVYVYTNKKDNKKYVGVTTTSIKRRFNHHNYKGKFKIALDLDGIDNFTVEIVAHADNAIDAGKLEQEYIKKYDSINNGYNTQGGGSGVSRPVICIETGHLFPSIQSASKYYGVYDKGKRLRKHLEGKIDNFCDLHWRYYEEERYR